MFQVSGAGTSRMIEEFSRIEFDFLITLAGNSIWSSS